MVPLRNEEQLDREVEKFSSQLGRIPQKLRGE